MGCETRNSQKESAQKLRGRSPIIMAKNREAQINERLAQMPQTMRKSYEKAAHGKGSPRNAIKAFCCECIGYERKEIALCTDLGCPVYAFRPKFREKDTSTGP